MGELLGEFDNFVLTSRVIYRQIVGWQWKRNRKSCGRKQLWLV